MRSAIFLILSIWACVLYSQVQNLPDIKVSGQSELKPMMFKRTAVLNPLISKGDSLPSFVPNNNIDEETNDDKSSPKVTGFAQLEINAAFGVNSFVSLFPDNSNLHSVSHLMRFEAPRTNTISIQNHLNIGGELLPSFPVGFKLDHASIKSENFKANHFLTKLAHHRANLVLGEVSLFDLHAHIGLANLRQTVRSDDYNKDFLDLSYSSRMQIGSFDSRIKFITHSENPGIQIAPKLKWEPFDAEDVRIHLLADEYRVIPSLEFKYRTPTIEKAYISISNSPLLSSDEFTSILENSPWIRFDDNHKLEKTPLNLTASVEYWYNKQPEFSLRSLKISNNSKYSIHSPVLTGSNVYGVAALNYCDVASNTSSVEASFLMNNFLLTQNLELDFSYIASESMRRAPYRPILGMSTRASFTQKTWSYLLEVSQQYFKKDHLGYNQPEAVIGNIGIEYRKDNSLIYAQLSNIFNHRQWYFSEHPSKKRNLYLGLKLRF